MQYIFSDLKLTNLFVKFNLKYFSEILFLISILYEVIRQLSCYLIPVKTVLQKPRIHDVYHAGLIVA